MTNTPFSLGRRRFLVGGATAAAALALPWGLASRSASAGVREFALSPQPGEAGLLGPVRRPVAIWGYGGQVPGQPIRVRQGERLRVVVNNRLAEETTVHWHGLRVPNDQDGVPHLTQKPIAPGERFTYEFDVPDAGTFWYHPHQRSFEQVGRGLYGPLIVEEATPIRVDRELVWVLDDWRLTREGQLSDSFGHPHDMSHGGQVGNTVTVNGVLPGPVPLRRGERIRLRLINAANARTFALNFQGHAPKIIAIDGQPVTPHAPADGRVVLGAAMRMDLVLDAMAAPGTRHAVRDEFFQGMEYDLLELVYSDKPLRERALQTPIQLPPNPLAEPDLEQAKLHEVRFEGGMMGDLSHAKMDGKRVGMMQMMHSGKAWAVNGVVATGHIHEPMLTLTRGGSYRLKLINDTAWHHPIHFHGHSFRVLSRNGRPTAHREWQDTVLMNPNERVEIAFVADNPGDWMFHCHILEHQAAGMMGVIRVA
jgi:FtsP/CotA-like multicopper oxidase with cupredoxin domain